MDSENKALIIPMIEAYATPEQFHDLKEQIITDLFSFLKEIVDLEQEMSQRLKSYEKLAGEGSLTEERMARMSSDIFAEHRERRQKIAEKKCAKEFLEKYREAAIASPSKYDYVVSGCEKCIFTMKKPRQALVEVEFRKGSVDCKHRFRLKKEKDEWKLYAFNVWTSYDHQWHRGGI